MTLTATLRRRLAAVLPSFPASPQPTRRPLLLARLFLSLLVAGGLAGGARGQGQAPPWSLAQTISDTSSNREYYKITASAVDAAGNVFVTGSFTGTVTFGTTTLTSLRPTATITDMFVAKWDAVAQAYTWATSGGSIGPDAGTGIAVYGAGIFVTGYITGPTGAAPIAGQNISRVGGKDIFVAKYVDTSTGHTPATSSFANGWAVSAGGPTDDVSTGIAVNGTGVFVTGYFETGNVTIAGQSLTSRGRTDIFVAKYIDTSTGSTPATSSFANGWVATGGGTDDDAGYGIAVRGAEVFVTGVFSSNRATVIAGQAVTGAGYGDMFVAKYYDTSTGSTAATSSFANGWVATGGGLGYDWGSGITLNGTSVIVTGNFLSGANAVIAGQALAGAGDFDVFVAKYSDTSTGSAPATSSFTNGWATSGGGNFRDISSAITSSGSSIYVTGTFTTFTNARFAGQSFVELNEEDIFVAKYVDTSTGSTTATSSFANGWATNAGNLYGGQSNTVGVSGQNVYVAGSLSDVATFGTLTVGSSSGNSIFLARLTDPALPLAATASAARPTFTLAPNPAHGTAQVRGTVPGTTLTVRDALGRELRTATADAAGTATLRLEGLAAGVYVVLGGGAVGRLVVE